MSDRVEPAPRMDRAPATFVLVPGAGGDGWYWHLVEPELRSRGHDVVAVTLPAGDDDAGWAEYTDAIVSAARDHGRVILVAQSLGGFSGPLACARLPADLLVMLNAMIPLPGETGGDWWANTGAGAATDEYLRSLGLSPDDADETVLFFHDMPPDVLAELFQRGEPNQSMTPMLQPWPLPAWPNVPTRVIAGRDDRLFPVAFQRRVARERLGVDIDELPGGHMLALSHPTELAEKLAAFAAEAG